MINNREDAMMKAGRDFEERSFDLVIGDRVLVLRKSNYYLKVGTLIGITTSRFRMRTYYTVKFNDKESAVFPPKSLKKLAP